jgi:CheY-like chemotaxis protein
LQASEFDAVETDLSMVGMSGLELARNFRQVRSDMPIIITSGYFRREDQEAAQQLGIDALIHKPNTTQDLGKILHRLLTK